MLGEYVRLLLLPFGLSAVHDYRVATSILDPRVLAGAAVAAGVGALTFRFRRAPAAALGIALLLFPLVPALYVPALGEALIAERYLYLPSAGLALLVAVAWDAWPWRRPAGTWTRAAAAAVLVVAGAATTIDRNRVWHDDLTLWTDAAKKAPGSAAAHEYLGFALLTAGQPTAAASSLSRAIEIDPTRHDARTNLASALAALGRSEEAMVQLEPVLAARPLSAEAHAILGYALAARGRLPEAAAAYRRALQLDASLARVHNALGVVLAQLAEPESAAAEFREAMRLDPSNPAASTNLRLLGVVEAVPASVQRR
jgi:Flp pilus assembly protein TadD